MREGEVIEVEPETLDLSRLAASVEPRVKGVTLENMEIAIRARAGELFVAP